VFFVKRHYTYKYKATFYISNCLHILFFLGKAAFDNFKVSQYQFTGSCSNEYAVIHQGRQLRHCAPVITCFVKLVRQVFAAVGWNLNIELRLFW